jgi:hypothetical protein
MLGGLTTVKAASDEELPLKKGFYILKTVYNACYFRPQIVLFLC